MTISSFEIDVYGTEPIRTGILIVPAPELAVTNRREGSRASGRGGAGAGKGRLTWLLRGGRFSRYVPDVLDWSDPNGRDLA